MENNNSQKGFINFLKIVFGKMSVWKILFVLFLRKAYIRYPHGGVYNLCINCVYLKFYTIRI